MFEGLMFDVAGFKIEDPSTIKYLPIRKFAAIRTFVDK